MVAIRRQTLDEVQKGDIAVWAYMIDEKTGLPRTDKNFQYYWYVILTSPIETISNDQEQKTSFTFDEPTEDGDKIGGHATLSPNTGGWFLFLARFDRHVKLVFYPPEILSANNLPGDDFPDEKHRTDIRDAEDGDTVELYTRAEWPDGTYSFFLQPLIGTVTGHGVGKSKFGGKEIDIDWFTMTDEDGKKYTMNHRPDEDINLWTMIGSIDPEDGSFFFSEAYYVAINRQK